MVNEGNVTVRLHDVAGTEVEVEVPNVGDEQTRRFLAIHSLTLQDVEREGRRLRLHLEGALRMAEDIGQRMERVKRCCRYANDNDEPWDTVVGQGDAQSQTDADWEQTMRDVHGAAFEQMQFLQSAPHAQN